MLRFELFQPGARGGITWLKLEDALQAINTLIVVVHDAGKPQPRHRIARVARDGFCEQTKRGLSMASLECCDS